MKQRLLYAFLMLFTALGMIRADGTFTVTSDGTKALTVTTTTANISVIDVTDNVTLSIDAKTLTIAKGYSTQVIVTTNSESVTFNGNMTALTVSSEEVKTLSFASGSSIKTLTLTDASGLTSLDCSNLKLETLTITTLGNNFTKLDVSGNPLLSSISNLPTTLTSLDIHGDAFESLTLSSLTSLASLNISGNKIKKLENLPSSLVKDKITWGTQNISASYDKKANENFSIAGLVTDAGVEAGTYTVSDWKKKDNNGNYQKTDDARQLDSGNKDVYRFFNSNNIYQHGDYQCLLTASDGKKFAVEFTVKPAEFNMKVATLPKGSIKVTTTDGNEVTSGTVKQGQTLSVGVDLSTAVNYEFVTFKDQKGLKLVENNSWTTNPVYCVVEGKYTSLGQPDESPYVNAEVKGKDAAMVINSPDPLQGKVTVEKSDAAGNYSAVNNGDKVPYGTKLRITVTPEAGYLAKLLVNKVDKTPAAAGENQKQFVVSDYEVTGDCTITASFSTIGTVDITAFINNVGIGKQEGSTGIVLLGQIDFNLAGEATKTLNEMTQTVALSVGTEYQMSFNIGVSTGIVNEILLDGKKKLEFTTEPKDDASITYHISFVVPEQDATIYISIKKQTPVTIMPRKDEDPSKQKQIYDGSPKSLIFTTSPAGLEKEVKVLYQLSANAVYGETAPTLAGTYNVKYSRPATGNYGAVAEATYELIIEKATPEITTIPTVTVEEGKYVLKNGVAKFGSRVLDGTFSVTDPGSPNVTTSHLATIAFTPVNEDAVNFTTATVQQEVVIDGEKMDRMAVKIGTLPQGVTVTMLNGGVAPVKSGDKFVAGTKLAILVNYPEGVDPSKVKVTKTLVETGDLSAPTPNPSDPVARVKAFEYTVPAGTDAEVLAVTIGDLPAYKYVVTLTKFTTDYTGTPIEYDAYNTIPADGSITIAKDKDAAGALSTMTRGTDYFVTYKKVGGEAVPMPEDAGDYLVCIRIPANPTAGYQAFYQEFAGMMTINQALPMVKKWPTARPIAKGQKLSQAVLVAGSSNVSGTFDWMDKDKNVRPKNGDKYEARFIPDNSNYKTVVTPNGTEKDATMEDSRIVVTVSDQQLVTFNPKYGAIAIQDNKGNVYESGTPVTKGTVLTITTTPDEGFVLKSISINDVSFSGSTYTVKDESVAIEATFIPKVEEPEIPDPEIDPNSQYAVTLPKADAVRGVLINKPGVNAVTKDKPFNFTLDALAADTANIVVKVNDSVLKPFDGTYTIAKVTGNTTVKISLEKPTPLKVSIETTTKNAKGYVIGKVRIDGPSDSTYYYNDEITLVAYPESGVSFTGWSDDKTVKDQLRTITLTEDITIKPLFSGVPTGIDAIETVQIYGGEGCIIITGAGRADVTIVSMDGRIQRKQISGDSRIELSSGVYGVILEEGTNVIRTKVIVK